MNQIRLPDFLLFMVVLLLAGCGTSSEFGNEATRDYSRAETQKFAKYMITGKNLYVSHCSNCHQSDGQGLAKLYPPLAQSDYMLKDKERTICLIKNGIREPIIVNGIEYEQPMPAFKELSNLELAEISTYIYNSWGNETGFVTVSEVENALSNCN